FRNDRTPRRPAGSHRHAPTTAIGPRSDLDQAGHESDPHSPAELLRMQAEPPCQHVRIDEHVARLVAFELHRHLPSPQNIAIDRSCIDDTSFGDAYLVRNLGWFS